MREHDSTPARDRDCYPAVMRDQRNTDAPRVLAITACPTGIAHTYMAAENLETAAKEMGLNLRVETHGSVGVEGTFSREEIAAADAILISADTVIDKDRFAGKKLLSTSVDAAIKNPQSVLDRALNARVWQGRGSNSEVHPGEETGDSIGRSLYQALMNGVSHMVPFVVTGGLLIAISLSLGGTPTPEGLTIPEDSFWYVLNSLGALAFSLMVPVLSAYIASGIAGRPGLAPGFITGLIAVTGSLYDSEAGAGFIGGIITGFLSGYVALAIKKIPVGKYLAAIMPVIVIPIFTTLIVGLLFIYVLGGPISALFESLSTWLSSLQGASVIVLGAVLGAMIAFDMGGPFNKTAFLFGGGMIAGGNAAPMGMVAAAIAVPPLAVGLATLIRRHWFTGTERDSGTAALIMGFFGITEGAIPLAAARPLQVIPANVAGGAVAGAVAGLSGVKDNVMHGGPIVAVLGAVENTVGFFIALVAGVAATTVLMLVLVGVANRTKTSPETDPAVVNEESPGAATRNSLSHATDEASASAATVVKRDTTTQELIDAEITLLDAEAPTGDMESVIRAMTERALSAGRISEVNEVVHAALARESQATTAVGHRVAIPHARTAAVISPTLVFARLAEPGVQWNAPDHASVRLVFLIAVPDNSGKQHLKILSKLARAIMREDFRTRLLTAESKDEVLHEIRQVTSS